MKFSKELTVFVSEGGALRIGAADFVPTMKKELFPVIDGIIATDFDQQPIPMDMEVLDINLNLLWYNKKRNEGWATADK